MFSKTALFALAALAGAQQSIDHSSISQNWNQVVAHVSAARPMIENQPALLQQVQNILGANIAVPSAYDAAIVSRIENELPSPVGNAILGISNSGVASATDTSAAHKSVPTVAPTGTAATASLASPNSAATATTSASQTGASAATSTSTKANLSSTTSTGASGSVSESDSSDSSDSAEGSGADSQVSSSSTTMSKSGTSAIKITSSVALAAAVAFTTLF
ncbi:hypothetical protein GGI12_002484 [Dipsacomyces acuminosporus]|nr:hypothetical protein GGI12_002484 [Dipsacomyces acuminosporus]